MIEYGHKESGTRTPHKRSRTILLRLKDEDGRTGRFYRCWNCGFICDTQKNALGGSEGSDGTAYTDVATPSMGRADSSDIRFGYAQLRGIGGKSVAVLEVGSNGQPKGIQRVISHITGSGCPLCGTENWRGDY